MMTSRDREAPKGVTITVVRNGRDVARLYELERQIIANRIVDATSCEVRSGPANPASGTESEQSAENG